jgi:hypothetical protein
MEFREFVTSSLSSLAFINGANVNDAIWLPTDPQRPYANVKAET